MHDQRTRARGGDSKHGWQWRMGEMKIRAADLDYRDKMQY